MRVIFACAILLSFEHLARAQMYHAASVDADGRVHLVLSSGEELTPALPESDVRDEDAQVSPDGHSAGWLEDWPIPNDHPYPVNLVVLYGAAKPRVIRSEQTIWSWRFSGDANAVAYCEGPTHGGAQICKLVDFRTGRLRQKWTPAQGANPAADALAPNWVRGLRY